MLSFFPSSPLMLSLLSRVFGCVVFVHSHNPHHGKLDPKAIKCVFIDYTLHKKGFKCYYPPSRRFFVSIDGESYLEVESIIESLPFPTQDVQDGHNMKECLTKPLRKTVKECLTKPLRKTVTAFTTLVDSSIPSSFPNSAPIQQNTLTNVPTMTPEASSPWYFNSGAFNHMTNNVQLLTNIKKYFGNLKIHFADGNQLPITTIGDISSFLTNIFVSAGLMSNLVSVGQLVDNDCRDQHLGKIIKRGLKLDFFLLLCPNLSLPLISYNSPIRLGHPNSNVLHNMLKYSFLGNKHTPSLNFVHFDCISCKIGKSKILPFPTRHLNLFYLGLFSALKRRSVFCFQILVFLCSNLILFQNQIFFALIMEGNTHHIHSRNSCNSMALYLKDHAHQAHNKMESHVTSHFWCKALSTAIHLINRLLSPSLGNESPFTWLFGHPPDYSTLCIFNCVCYVHLPPQECTKLNAQSVQCVFLGYSPHQKGFIGFG
ncbi:hypothetical protein CR513_57607, partial [Mucuna pruriens]